MQDVLYSLFTHWSLFLMGFVAGTFWASRPREELVERHVRN